MDPTKMATTTKPQEQSLHSRKEQAVLDAFAIAQRFTRENGEQGWRNGEDVLVEALRRWRDKDVF